MFLALMTANGLQDPIKGNLEGDALCGSRFLLRLVVAARWKSGLETSARTMYWDEVVIYTCGYVLGNEKGRACSKRAEARSASQSKMRGARPRRARHMWAGPPEPSWQLSGLPPVSLIIDPEFESYISRDGGAISETNFSFPLTRKRSVVPFGKYDRLILLGKCCAFTNGFLSHPGAKTKHGMHREPPVRLVPTPVGPWGTSWSLTLPRLALSSSGSGRRCPGGEVCTRNNGPVRKRHYEQRVRARGAPPRFRYAISITCWIFCIFVVHISGLQFEALQ
ncbi:hypothetical protein BJV77DRAFT_1153784 [Russula vinacea]|nr:hypothetical protein BJV77DRAFT_1153784 [Russula vinacea]